MTAHCPRVITLLTDFGNQDAYVGTMKGVIAGINPFANIIDICHSIPPQDIFSGAYLLYASYKYFPRKTIHVAVIDPGVGSKRDIICVETKDYFFLVPDNGLLSFILQEERPKSIFRVTNSKYLLPSPSSTFHGRDVFAPVAAHLSLGVKPRQLGIKINQLEQLDIPKPVHKKTGHVEGQIIYIDQFGNLITNITKEYIAHLERNYEFMETTIGKKKIVGLSKTYTDAKPREPLVLFGSAGFLEVSINQGNARKYFRVDRGNKVIIKCNPGTIR